MTHPTRRTAVLLLVLALAGLFLLSISLTDLQLQPGGPFPGAGPGGATQPATSEAPSQPGSAVIFEAVLGVIAVTLLVFLPRRLLGLFSARNVIWLLLGLTVLTLIFAILPRIVPGSVVPAAQEAPGAGKAPPFTYAVSPLGDPPPAFAWLAAAGVLLVVALAAIVMLRGTSRPAEPSQVVAEQAEQALRELSAGRDFHDVIIRCYLEMMETLKRAQQLERQQGMTAREYEDWLATQGVPSAPIQQLTGLFEKVRYGNERVGEQEEEEAKECLTEIVRICGPGARR